MENLITTPHDFIWRVKNPDQYWADSYKDIKYNVYIDGKLLGGFSGVNRTFDDDNYYVNYFNELGKFDYRSTYRDTEIVLEPIS